MVREMRTMCGTILTAAIFAAMALGEMAAEGGGDRRRGAKPLKNGCSVGSVPKVSDHSKIGDIRRIQEATFRQAATIAITSQPSALHRVISRQYATELMKHSSLSNFRRLVSGGGKEAGMKGRRGSAAGMFKSSAIAFVGRWRRGMQAIGKWAFCGGRLLTSFA